MDKPIEQEQPGISPKTQRRIEEFSKDHLLPSFKDEDGQEESVCYFKEPRLQNLLDAEDSTPVMFDAGRGAVVPHDREILTTGLVDCIAVYMEGENGKAIFHMTPAHDHGLGYKNPILQTSIDRMEEYINALGDREKTKILIVANLTGDRIEDKYKNRALKKVEEEFKFKNINSVRTTNLPCGSTLFYSPADSQEEGTFAIGEDHPLIDRSRPTQLDVYNFQMDDGNEEEESTPVLEFPKRKEVRDKVRHILAA